MSARMRPVAMLDSGLGGLTVLTALRALVPRADVVYFADTANVPYGDRALGEIAALGTRISERLAAVHDPCMVIVASGTTCGAFDRHGWPKVGVPLVGVIEAGARSAVRATRTGSIGVIATTGTVASGSFERSLRTFKSDARVTNVAAPALVPIVEAGESSSERAQLAVAAACTPLIAGACDAVILGCTHFPHLRRWFQVALGPGVALVDPADECAAEAVARLPAAGGSAAFVCEVSGDERLFAQHAAALGAPGPTSLSHVELSLVTEM